MNPAQAIVLFIYVLAHSSQPGFPKAQMQWVLYGAPTEQLAREWAQAKFAEKLPRGYTIERLLVLPMSDTMYTEDGPILAPWTALPTANQRAWNAEAHDTFHIRPQKNGNSAAPPKMAPKEEREALQKSLGDSVNFNWDEKSSWYYIVYTKSQAVLVNEVNAAAAAIPYRRAVLGTPAAGEVATVSPWQELTLYKEPPPAQASP